MDVVWFSVFWGFFIPVSSKLTTTSEEIPQWYSSTYSESTQRRITCVCHDCLAQIAAEVSFAVKPNGFATKSIMKKPKIWCAHVLMKESSVSKKKKRRISLTWDYWLNWKQNTETAWWHMPFYFSAMCKKFIQMPLFYICITALYFKDVACYFENYTF